MRTVPVTFFGIVLGLAGLGNAWRVAHVVWGVPIAVGEGVHLVAALIWLLLVASYVAKWVWAPAEAQAEVNHPIACCFIGVIGVTGMLVAGGIRPHAEIVGLVLYALSFLFTLGFAVWRTGGLWKGGRDPSSLTAILYLPAGAGSFVTGIVGAAFGFDDLAKMAFGAGLFSWLAIEAALLYRLFTSAPLAEPLRPTLGVQLAPPTVGGLAYLSATKGLPDAIAYSLLGYGILTALILLRLLPWIRRQPFNIGYWAFSFGAVALPTLPLRMMDRGATGILPILAPILFVAANLVIALLSAATLVQLAKGRLLPAPAPTPTHS